MLREYVSKIYYYFFSAVGYFIIDKNYFVILFF